MVISNIIKIFKRITTFNKKLNVFYNGENNDYPEKVDRLINNSVTAKRGAHIIKSMILGKGFDNNNDFIVDNSKGTTLYECLNSVTGSFSRQNGFYIQIDYFVSTKIKSLKLLPFTHCRVGKKDDDSYSGKIEVKDWQEKTKTKAKIVDVYNPSKNVILAQMKAAGGINKYNGQILFVNPSEYIYPLSKIDPVMNDADSESQVSIFKNTALRKGFFGKQIVITEPFTDGEMDVTSEEYIKGDTARTNFIKNLQNFMGAENADGIFHLEAELIGGELEKSIIFKTIDTNINDKLFAHTEDSISSNIAVSFSIPINLIRPNKGAFFGQSGETIKQMKLFVQEETLFERSIIEITFNGLMKKFKDYDGKELKIIPLIEEDKQIQTTTSNGETFDSDDQIRKKAQAALKGSVGGVQALLQIQQSVKAGTTDRASAITIIKEIFGIEEDLANAILGVVVEENKPIEKT